MKRLRLADGSRELLRVRRSGSMKLLIVDNATSTEHRPMSSTR